MAATARWYLAAITMLALILIAIHFSLQVQAQQQAKKLVSAWAEHSRFSVGDVRYRMLRGALTLIDARFEQESIQFYAPTVFLHGNLSSLSGNQPQVSAVEIGKAEITLTTERLKEIVAGSNESEGVPALFAQLWNSAKRASIYQSQLHLLPDMNAPSPEHLPGIRIIRLESSTVAGERSVEALARWLGGEIRATSHTMLTDEPDRYSNTVLSWHGLEALAFFGDALGLNARSALNAQSGKFSGSLTWKQGRDDSIYTIAGEAEIEEREDQQGRAHIGWQGSIRSGKWQGDITASAWPLTMFAAHLPEFQGRGLSAGRFDGDFKLAGNLKQWQMEVNRAALRDIQYRHVFSQEEISPAWRVEALALKNVHLQWPERSIEAEEISLSGVDMIIGSRTVVSNNDQWNIEVDELRLDRFKPTVRLSENLLHLPMLAGKGSLRRDGKMQLKLHTSAPLPESKEGELVEQWKLSGDGMLMAEDASRFKLNVTARNAALVRFRPLMPEFIRNDASDISGRVDLKLSILMGSAPWQSSGELSLADTDLQYGGERWLAETINIELESIGTAQSKQHIRRIDVQNWHYQAALRPLYSDVSETAEKKSVVRAAEPWHVQHLLLNSGIITAGNMDAMWMRDVDIQINNLYPADSPSPIKLTAKLGDGSLTLRGDLLWHSDMPELASANISMRDTLPFFMNQWLSLSGLPKLLRGRIYADISFKKEAEMYHGLARLRLQRGLLGSVSSETDPLLGRVGYNSHDVFSALQKGGKMSLHTTFKAEGDLGDVVGDALIQTLKKEMGEHEVADTPIESATSHLLSSIRLHAKGSLSHNERVRLRKVIQDMRQEPDSVIELKPRLSASSQDEKQFERARYTQQLIEKFLTYRGISRSRIFPVWPNAQHQSSSSTSGISIVTIP